MWIDAALCGGGKRVGERKGLKCSNLGDIVPLKRTIVRATVDLAGARLFVFPNLTHAALTMRA